MTIAKFQHENGHLAASAAVVEQSEGLPAWLDASASENGNGRKASLNSAPAASGPAPRNDEPAETFSLITEDDLPEWLRALGDQEFETEAPPPPSLNTKAVVPPAIASAAPTISRAWLSRPRDAEPDSAGQVATDFTPLESGPTVGVKRRTTPQTDELTPLELDEHSVPVPDAVVEASAQPDTRRVRLIMLSVVVLLVVILGYYAVSNFL